MHFPICQFIQYSTADSFSVCQGQDQNALISLLFAMPGKSCGESRAVLIRRSYINRSVVGHNDFFGNIKPQAEIDLCRIVFFILNVPKARLSRT